MIPSYVRSLRRILLLLPALARAAVRGEGVPIAKAVELTGARSERELREGIAALEELWTAPDDGEGELPVALTEEDGELFLTYPEPFGKLTAFSLAESAVLLAALRPLEREGAGPVAGAVRKLRRAIPEVLQAEATALAGGLDVATEPPGPWADALGDAIARRVEVVIEYRAAVDDSLAARTVEPRLLLPRDRTWYLAAWSVAKGEEHLYRLDRIASVAVGTRVFGEHKGPPTSRYAKNLFFASGQERDVTVRYAGLAALQLRRDGARVREEPGGRVTVTTRANPGSYLFGVLLGHGGEAAVVGPPDVAEGFAKRLAELEALYR